MNMGRGKVNHFNKARGVSSCDECGKSPENKILWSDMYRYLWCTNCWEFKERLCLKRFVSDE